MTPAFLADLVAQLAQMLLVVAIAPLLLGVTRKVKARLLRRIGPGLFQPYRDLWKLLHKAWRADQAVQQDAQVQAQALRPAVRVAGAATGGGVRDELGTKEWMARRNQQAGGWR